MSSPGRRRSPIGYEVACERDLRVRARDGVPLATDVYRPALSGRAAPGRFPTLLERTPYDKRRPVLARSGRFFAERGYAVVMQDVRGRHASGGSWEFLAPVEGSDGCDTLAWIAAQGWSDGRVGTLGLSYSTANQQALALLRPPELAAQFLSDGGYNYFHRTLRHSGALELGVALPYVLRMALQSQELARDEAAREAFSAALAGLPDWLGRTPLRYDDSPLRHAPPYYRRWFEEMLDRERYDDYWKHPGWNTEEHVAGYADVPVYLQSSWYGHHVWATAAKYAALRARGGAAVKLLIGHWLHGYDEYARSHAGEVDFGPQAALDLDGLRLRWFDQCLRGMDTGILEEPPVRIFVMGGGAGSRDRAGRLQHGGRWRDEREWPLARARQTRFHLRGGGRLAREAPPPDEQPSRYAFDPSDPVPTVGGGTQNPLWPGLIQGGAFDQRGRSELWACRDTRPLAERPDVLVFQTGPLPADLEVTGPIELRLWVASSAPDTDFTAKLVDVYPPGPGHPEGFAMNLTDGVLRARWRASRERAQLLVPEQVHELTVELQATSNLFRAGHRVRLDVSSSNFPRFDVNPNTGEPAGRSRDWRVAHNTLFHDAARPSHVVLPLVPP